MRKGFVGFNIGSWRFGFEHSTIGIGAEPYMSRWIVFLGHGGLRLHKFYRGDDDRAPHDHPFWFITIPLGQSYWEKICIPKGELTWASRNNFVRAWRPHFRPASYKHIVTGVAGSVDRPWWTFVIFGYQHSDWGFWPAPNKFVPWKEWR